MHSYLHFACIIKGRNIAVSYITLHVILYKIHYASVGIGFVKQIRPHLTSITQ
jgi:hypothetical protein